jgi:hypothetical protein
MCLTLWKTFVQNGLRKNVCGNLSVENSLSSTPCPCPCLIRQNPRLLWRDQLVRNPAPTYLARNQ